MTQSYLQYIPEELRVRPQWCIAGSDGAGKFKAPHVPNERRLANVVDSTTWRSFDVCMQANQGYGLGYILHESDPYTVIDLDVKNANNYPNNPELWTTQEELDRFNRIIEAFDSYTERSASGQGFHIWVRGAIGRGGRRDGVEVYSQERFIITTGYALWPDKPIMERQELLNVLLHEIRSGQHQFVELEEVEEIDTDQYILDKLYNAANGDKFFALWQGKWQGEYPSQSEADLALMSMFTFYSPSNEQCRRMFRGSALGKREKAVKNNVYLNRTLRLIRSRMAAENTAAEHGKQLADSLMAAFNNKIPTESLTPPAPQNPIITPTPAPALVIPEWVPEEAAQTTINNAQAPQTAPTVELGLPWPPGVAGELARHMNSGAVRPVKEVSIVSALGMLAGIAGKVYQIGQSGLNLYIVLIARSGVGKEDMHSGMMRVMYEMLASGYHTTSQYIEANEFASAPALIKAINEKPSFVNLSGEWGRRLKRLSSEDGHDGPMQQFRTALTNLYQKSGHTSVVGGISYSDKDKNIQAAGSVAYSMIGETTPGTFYESLTPSMMEDGFLSRFVIIEYTGDRPEFRKMQELPKMNDKLMDAMGSLVKQADHMIMTRTYQAVQASEVGGKLLDDFNDMIDRKLNATPDDESVRQMYNRAHLKALRIASLLACADNCLNPVISEAHARWAIEVINNDIGIMTRRMSDGDIGLGDAPRERKLISVMTEYLSEFPPASYGVNESMRQAVIVSRSYLMHRTSKLNLFNAHRMGANRALDDAIRALIDNGCLQEMDKTKMIESYGFHGKAYRIIRLPK